MGLVTDAVALVPLSALYLDQLGLVMEDFTQD